MQNVRSSYDPQARALYYQLMAASFALADALDSAGHRTENVEEACEALAAFQLLERGLGAFVVPREVRDRVGTSLEALREGRLESAHALLGRAGGAFERYLLEVDRPRRWTD